MILHNSRYGVVRRVGSEVHKEYLVEMDKLKYVINEICISVRMKHANIVRTVRYEVVDNRVTIVQEYADGGDLLTFASGFPNNRVPEDITLKLTSQLLMALSYIHANDVIHRDIKPENILLHGGVVKLCDFGLACMPPSSEWCGTREFMAPEVILGKTYGPEVDMWSVGCVVYELIFGMSPFYNDDDATIDQNILHGSVSFLFPVCVEVLTLILKLLCKDPTMRLTATEAISLIATGPEIRRRSRSTERFKRFAGSTSRSSSVPRIKKMSIVNAELVCQQSDDSGPYPP
jgi:serine/threonine protein kinase